MDTPLLALEEALRHGKLDAAISHGRKALVQPEGPARETAISIARAAAGAWREFLTEPIQQFAAQAPDAFGEEHGSLIAKALDRLFRMAEEWHVTVDQVHRERLARDIRDSVRFHHKDAALAAAKELVSYGRTQEERDVQAAFIGGVLATVLNQPKEAEEVLRHLVGESRHLEISDAGIEKMISTHRTRSAAMMNTRMEAVELEWTRTLVKAETLVIEKLPGKNVMQDLAEEALRDVTDVFRCIARVPLDHGAKYFADMTVLFADFSPGSVSKAAKLSGAEDRSYSGLGFAAKKAVLQSFMAIGKSGRFTAPYADWLKDNLQGPHGHRALEVAGMLRNEAFTPLLYHCFENKKYAELKPLLIDAMGNIGSPDSIRHLESYLHGHARNLTKHPELRPEVKRTIEALGKVVRSPRTSDKQRRDVILSIVKEVPPGDTRLAAHAAREVLCQKPEELTAKERQWAIHALTDALWTMDDQWLHAQGEEKATAGAHLGHRRWMAEALRKLAPQDLEYFLTEVDRHSAQFSGAYMAVADVLEHVGDERAVPVLERILLSSFSHNPTNEDLKYQREQVWDATAQSHRTLDRDTIIAPIVFTVGTIGGEPGKALLVNLAKQVRAGRLALPGTETARFLDRFAGTDLGEGAALDAVDTIPAGELKQLIKEVTSNHLLSGADKRRLKKISAMSKLAQASLPQEALHAMFEQLTDKDLMVVNAAVGALAACALPDKPEAMRRMVVSMTLEHAVSRDPALRIEAIKVLRDIGPNQPEVRSQVEKCISTADNREAKEKLRALLGTVGGSVPPGPMAGPVPVGTSAMVAEKKSALDVKREYIEARRQWIAGGKKGPPPEAPPDA